jgi:DNA-binding response OmpR family regulator
MAPGSKATVLVVDDDENLADQYSTYLADEYDVRTAYNGGEALIELDESVDIVILDRKMPGMRGEKVLEEIREWLDWCRVIMVTGVEPEFDIITLPFDEYLNKPIDEQELKDTVDQMLLLDEYDDLLHEYLSLTKRYATLKSHKDPLELEASDEFKQLEAERETIREEIADLVASFTDAEFRAAFETVHQLDE